MKETPAERHRKYFRQLRKLRQFIPWAPAYFFVAAQLARIHCPVRDAQAQYEVAWGMLGHSNPRAIWGRFLQRAGVSNAASFLQGEGLPVRIEEDDPDGVLATARSQGTLILTYHHQFAYLFCSVLGHLGVPLNALTMDPAMGPLHSLLPEFGPNIFGDSERHFRGGRYFFLNPNNPRSYLLPVLRSLLRGTSIVSANDFDNTFPQFESHACSIMGAVIQSPTGVIPYALDHRVPIAAGYLDWQGGNRFRIYLRFLKRPGEELPLADVYARYMTHLEDIALHHPELWEGLVWLKEQPKVTMVASQ
jgi:hypothetical protein